MLCCVALCCTQLMDVPELEEEGKEDITRLVSTRCSIQLPSSHLHGDLITQGLHTAAAAL